LAKVPQRCSDRARVQIWSPYIAFAGLWCALKTLAGQAGDPMPCPTDTQSSCPLEPGGPWVPPWLHQTVLNRKGTHWAFHATQCKPCSHTLSTTTEASWIVEFTCIPCKISSLSTGALYTRLRGDWWELGSCRWWLCW